MERRIITTKDGSHTVEIPGMQVTYHSHHGAVQESVHVFIEAGLRWHMGRSGQTSNGLNSDSSDSHTLRIFEMGFGTGLNAFLTAKEAAQIGLHIHYTAVELHPLSAEEVSRLNYAHSTADQALFYQLHHAPWNSEAAITPQFTLHKEKTNLLDFQPSYPVQVVYFDAFAPSAQPELWTEAVFKKLKAMMQPGGVLVTYCSKGAVRRAMQAAGFKVDKIPGPPGKREMVRATVPMTLIPTAG